MDTSSAAPKVVVIDDDRGIRELVALHLRNAGYRVFPAEDAVDGGRIVLRERPDLIVCDLQMPYLNGDEFVAALKSDEATKHIPVVLLSSSDDMEDHAAKLGVAAYLRKPVTVNRLLEAVSLYTA